MFHGGRGGGWGLAVTRIYLFIYLFSLLTILSHCKSNRRSVFSGDGFKHYGRLIVNVKRGLIVRLQNCVKTAGQRRLDFLCNDSKHIFTDNKTTDRITI